MSLLLWQSWTPQAGVPVWRARECGPSKGPQPHTRASTLLQLLRASYAQPTSQSGRSEGPSLCPPPQATIPLQGTPHSPCLTLNSPSPRSCSSSQPLSQASCPPLSPLLLHPDFLWASLSSHPPKQLPDLSPQRPQAWPTTPTYSTAFSQDPLLLHQWLRECPKDCKKRPHPS